MGPYTNILGREKRQNFEDNLSDAQKVLFQQLIDLKKAERAFCDMEEAETDQRYEDSRKDKILQIIDAVAKHPVIAALAADKMPSKSKAAQHYATIALQAILSTTNFESIMDSEIVNICTVAEKIGKEMADRFTY